ncbi:MAG TPA: efflux RND transporter periplasmic adaptor subunit [Moraxellaceae bacterium]|nr:efflux RND transporter periplasmic adaptor subunit [Moraxellaceae bacterium]
MSSAASLPSRVLSWVRAHPLRMVVLAALGLAIWSMWPGSEKAGPLNFRTTIATEGPLVVKVSATGNLQPTNQVDVGSELSGIVEKVFVDDNDQVRKGQVLAVLDLSKLNDAVSKSRANLVAAEAAVAQADATAAESRATWQRQQQVATLSGGKVPSQSELDVAEAAWKRAEAGVASARASVVQARAALQSDETNLYKASLRSPINGIVLARKVEPGQTVAASFQAPVLFTLAEDLARMELQVDVDEADVGQVKVGQQATFTVDAWPGRVFHAVITRVGYGSQTKEGVVSYLSVLKVDNDDLSLRPGMTGTAEITTLTRDKALLVPNAALRFTPPDVAAPGKKNRGSVLGTLMPRPSMGGNRQVRKKDGTGPRVWVLRDGVPVAVPVTTGASDGRVTEITGGDLKEGMAVITEAVSGGKP